MLLLAAHSTTVAQRLPLCAHPYLGTLLPTCGYIITFPYPSSSFTGNSAIRQPTPSHPACSTANSHSHTSPHCSPPSLSLRLFTYLDASYYSFTQVNQVSPCSSPSPPGQLSCHRVHCLLSFPLRPQSLRRLPPHVLSGYSRLVNPPPSPSSTGSATTLSVPLHPCNFDGPDLLMKATLVGVGDQPNS